MDYISVRQAADKWGVSVRQVQAFLKNDRIKGAERFDNHAWMIPADAQKPGDPRRERKTPRNDLSADLDYVVSATVAPWPSHNPDAILDTVSEKRLRLQYEGELAYLRGDFERVIRCFREIGDDDAAKLRACALTMAAAISTGDYPLFIEIETYRKGLVQAKISDNITAGAELALSTAYVSALAPNMVPEWLKNGDFSAFPFQAKPDVAYKRAKYFQSLGKFDAMLNVAQTALEFCESKDVIIYAGIYLRATCAMACSGLDRVDDAKRYLLDAMRIALPHGFITPFAEAATAFGGLLELCLEQEYPEYYDTIIDQWKRTFANWMTFHNQFTKDNITSILSLREYQIASLAVGGASYKKIADHFHISVGRLKTIMHEIYGKLFVSNRKELSQYIL